MSWKQTAPNLAEFVEFAFATDKAYKASMEDGEFKGDDLTNFINPGVKVPKVVEGFTLIPQEYKSLSEEEREEFMNYMKEEFDLEDDVLELLIENIVHDVVSLTRNAFKLNDYRKNRTSGPEAPQKPV